MYKSQFSNKSDLNYKVLHFTNLFSSSIEHNLKELREAIINYLTVLPVFKFKIKMIKKFFEVIVL